MNGLFSNHAKHTFFFEDLNFLADKKIRLILFAHLERLFV